MIGADTANRVVHRLSRSDRAARISGLIRNQATALIGYNLAPSKHPEDNGELWLVHQLGRRVECFIDVGANQGDWSALILAGSDARGIAVEPGGVAVERIRERSLPRLKIVHAGVSDTPGEATFYEEPDAGELSSFTSSHSSLADARRVPTVTIDGLLADSGWDHVDLVKIDTEGWDFHCLRGANDALAAHRIAVIQFEYSPTWADAGSTLKAAFAYLRSHGYRVAALRPSGLAEYDYRRYGELFRYSNFVAYSPRASSWFT